MPDRRAVADRAERDIAALCARGLTWTGLWSAVRRRLAEAIPFDAAALATIDPSTLLPTAGLVEALPHSYCGGILENELHADDFDKLAALARARVHVGVLGRSTEGRPDRSPRFRDVLAPLGLGRQVRAACVAGDGCWAWLDLYRARGAPEFTPAEAALLARVARRVGDAVRLSLLFDDGPARAPEDAAGLVVLGEGLDVLSADAIAERWLAELGEASAPGSRVPVPVHAVAIRACAGAGRAPAMPRARVRTARGRWVVLHAFPLRGPAGAEAAVVIEPAASVDLAEVRVRAFGLTATERRVLQLTLQGLSTKELAAELRISPYTARDHLTHVFDKTGTRSRAQLFAAVAALGPVADRRAAAPGAIGAAGVVPVEG